MATHPGKHPQLRPFPMLGSEKFRNRVKGPGEQTARSPRVVCMRLEGERLVPKPMT